MRPLCAQRICCNIRNNVHAVRTVYAIQQASYSIRYMRCMRDVDYSMRAATGTRISNTARVANSLGRILRLVRIVSSHVPRLSCVSSPVSCIFACITPIVAYRAYRATVRTLRREYKVCNLRTLRYGTVVG
jgi:hypothetical protein